MNNHNDGSIRVNAEMTHSQFSVKMVVKALSVQIFYFVIAMQHFRGLLSNYITVAVSQIVTTV